jgi:rhamnulokinase
LIKGLGLPARIFSRLVDPGTVLGALLPGHREALRLEDDVRVVATATHDTAAAFVGVPAGPGTAVLSSGTWSLLGLELDHPVLTDAARAAGLSNERGVFGTTRLLRNIMGLWLIQQCRATWDDAGSGPGYDDLVRLASSVTDEPKLFDPDEPSLAYPGDMPARIEALLENSGQHRPTCKGAMVRSIFVSLACKYRLVLEQLEHVSGRSIERIHVIGGGSRNCLLCQLTADITGREVLAGPAEASALGNVLMQAHALGYVSGADELREIARASVSTDRYVPVAERREADAVYRRFLTIAGPEAQPMADEVQGRNA